MCAVCLPMYGDLSPQNRRPSGGAPNKIIAFDKSH